ncbi:phosphodiester glycosidase family protein [Pengzhenrongella phosphoraccumulans]|uniref:phosphodiester glycosidase family protein n=1 Tax=Pengzhenrongella phosphoraccumulans TaxID=3114394 RepID=UPI00388D65D9
MRPARSLLTTGALLLALAVPPSAAVADSDGPGDRRPAESAPGSSQVADIPDLALVGSGASIVTDRSQQSVAPGVTLTSFDRLDARGWLRGDILTADLDGGSTVDYLNPGTVSGREVLSEQAARGHAVAGVNGDFFDINDTGAPLGVGIQRDADGGAGTLINAPSSGYNEAITIGADGLGRLSQLFLAGTADDGESVAQLTNLNSPGVADGGVGLYTPAWGAVGRDRTVDGVVPVREVILTDGIVTATTDVVGTVALAAGELALIGREGGVAALAGFEIGEHVEVTYGPRSDAGEIAVALGGNKVLARDGVVLDVDDVALHPRTAAGFSADGRRMWLLTVDGRQVDSRGLTELELGQMMVDLGADDVLNLDGGGSSTMLAREPGQAAPEVVNKPSDGGQRLTPNGLGLLAPAGSGQLTGFHVEPATATDPDAGSRTDDLRVLSGLSRVVVARGHDETFAPVPAAPVWNAVPGRTADVVPADGGTAIVTGRRPGVAVVAAQNGGVRGEVTLQVLGEPVRLAPSSVQISLPGAGQTGRLQVRGFDEAGFATWVEPRDIALDYDGALVEITPDGTGYAVRPRIASGVGIVTARVGELTTSVALTVGLKSEVVDTMDDAGRWVATAYPAQVQASASSAPGHDGGSGVALDYSLTGTTATRAAYLASTPRQVLPGAPQRVGAWVLGDGKGAWLRANVYDAAGGSAKTINVAAAIDWTGWRYVEAEVPAGLTMPLTLFRFYVVETSPLRQYAGRIVIDDITVSGAQEVVLPVAPVVTDPVVVTDGTVVERGRWRFAVLSDAQFTADAPDSDIVGQARRSIREALAADPEFLVVNGDFVDRGFPEDIALAKRVLDEEVGGRVPVYYVPGNHEAYGAGDLTSWEAVFGPASRTFDHRGTRFVLLDSSRGSFRAGGFDQLLMLRDALAGAKTDAAIRDVVVMAHHPIDDPAPTDNSQLADRKEAALVVDWLADVRTETGKGAAYLASHAGTFAASREDGVLLPLIGNSGKGPAAAPDAGGFTGWALVGIQDRPRSATPRHAGRPSDRADSWLRVELRPHVDTLELTAPARIAVGATAAVTAVVVQDGRRVPVAWPVSADWTGSRGLFVGAAAEAPHHAIASFDPATGSFTALRPGDVEVAVTVNGTRQTGSVTVTS